MVPKHTLNQREELVLQAVVQTYITTAEPAGSRSIVKRYSLDFSPATVRNVMSDLEDSGYLEQVHTSSGRVPTNQGYRYYVDFLMQVQELTIAERSRIHKALEQQLGDADEVLRQTSHLLALVSERMGVVEAPDERVAEVRHVEIIPIDGSRVALLLADSCGRVRTFTGATSERLSGEEASKLNRYLNESLRGVALDHLATTLETKLKSMVDENHKLADRAIRIMESIPMHRQGQLFIEGSTRLFEQPEFQDIDRAREVFEILEEQDGIKEMLRASWREGDNRSSRVLIGAETHRDGLEEISVVAAPYRVGGRTAGLVGVLGPRRMPYSRLTGVVEYTASLLGRFLTRLAGEGR